MMYELWHIASGNLLEEFASEREALEAVIAYLEANSPGLVDELAVSAVPTDESETRVPLPTTLAGADLRGRLSELHLKMGLAAGKAVATDAAEIFSKHGRDVKTF
jgi:hypothetical protein